MAIESAVLSREGMPGLSGKDLRELVNKELERRQAVTVEKDSVKLNPERMQLGRFYFAEYNGEPYIYRKTSEHEIEVYGMATHT